MKNNHKYSEYQIKKSMKNKIIQVSDNTYLVNNKYFVIDNKKNFRCNCKWFCDNKSQIRYCNHALSVLHLLDKEKFWEEINAHGIRDKDEKYVGSNYEDW
jgi:hypothetical protein